MNLNDDVLSDVLRMVQLKACIYFIKEMPKPWGMDIPRSANGPLHMVLDGECVLRSAGQDYRLNAGDAILLPHGASHQMLDNPSTIPEPGPAMMERLFKQSTDVVGHGSTRMLCGHFEWDGEIDHPFFRDLPELIVIRDLYRGENAQTCKSIVDLITVETVDRDPGSTAIADRIGEVLFIMILRTWIIENTLDTGVFAAINDARLSRALHYIHQESDREIDLNILAQVAGMSRTAFAVRFRETMGTPPAAYLKEWRMLNARRLLLSTKLPVSQIVTRIGYTSDAAFVRAFKRRYGETPSKVRRKFFDQQSLACTENG
ncbi:MAG: AraC family transcriptional regulator [Granulosicoccus sp.]|nr:AraC family transcriptional regulator [Granulosicoccus sp.]